MTRLPQPGKDAGQWGDILNDFLSQSHDMDGSLKAGSITRTRLASDVTATLAKADSALQTPDIAGKADTSSLARVATTGSYADLTSRPIIPATASDIGAEPAGLSGGTLSSLSATTDAQIAAAIAGVLGQFEMQPMWATGHSWLGSNSFTTPNMRYHERVASRLRMSAVTNTAVAGRTIGDMANLALGGVQAWTPRTLALVTAICTINDLTLFHGTTASRRGYNYAWKGLLSIITANAAIAATTPSFAYTGTWTTENVVGVSTDTAGAIANSTSGQRKKTSAAGDTADVSFTGTAVDVFLVARAAGAGLVTFTEGTTTLGTLDLTAATAQDCPAVFSIRSLAAGNHTIRATLTSGASMTVDSIRIPSEQPVPILIMGEPPVVPAGGDQPTYLADLIAFKSDLATICASFSTVIYRDLDEPDWDLSTMISPDGKHPNDAGAARNASKAIKSLATSGFFPGLNVLHKDYPAVYMPLVGTMAFGAVDGTGSPGLSVSAGNTNAALDWSRLIAPSGTTDYSVQYRTSPAGSWTSFSHTASTSQSITVTGLTNLTAYDFRVAPITGVGVGTYSGIVTATPTVPPTVYAADTFTRADSTTLGTSETGGLTWTRNNGSTGWTILSNTLSRALGAGVSADDCYLSDSQSDGTIQVTVTSVDIANGIVFRAAGATHATGYIFWRSSSALYTLSKRTGVGSYTALATYTQPPAAGDVMKVVLSGSSIKCYVNGVLGITATDSTNTGTAHGVWVNSGQAGTFDNYSHTSAST